MRRYEWIAVYILASGRNGTLYVGVKSDLPGRLDEHRGGRGSVFAARYGCQILVWYENFDDMNNAIAREKRLKNYPRRWKLNLIEAMNPHWRDLAPDVYGWNPS